MLNNS